MNNQIESLIKKVKRLGVEKCEKEIETLEFMGFEVKEVDRKLGVTVKKEDKDN